MFKKKLIKYYQIKSFALLLLSALLFAVFFSFSEFSYNYSSTGFSSYYNSYFFTKNSVTSFLLQQFGIAIYLLPVVFLIWSYRLFFNLKNRFAFLKVILLLIIITIAPLIIFTDTPDMGGILGSFLDNTFSNFSNYYLVLNIILCVLLFFVSGITISNLLTVLKIISFAAFTIFKIIYIYIFKSRSSLASYLKEVRHVKNNFNTVPESKLSAAFASLDKDLWDSNLATSISENSINKDTDNTKTNPIQDHEITKEDTSNKINFSSLFKNHSNEDNNINKTNNTHNKIKKGSIFSNNLENTSNVNNYSSYFLSTDLLDSKEERSSINTQEIKEIALKLEKVIQEFGINGKIVNIQTGPVVTLFEITIPPGIKTSKLTSLEADVALRMKAFSVRIAVVPGKDVIGIEIPNIKRKTVYLRKLLENKLFTKTEMALPINLGLDISGKPVIADLATMPHLLVAGTTGSGKSVAVNAMILSLLYKLSPKQCKMIMIDPKMLELSIYQDIPHLLSPVVTDPKKAIYALKWAVKQMEHRYSLMSYLGVRNINGYNEKIKDNIFISTIKASILEKDGFELDFPFMPYIIVIIDEMADLMMVAGKEIEAAVQRLAQMARAAGIHLIMATQRPSVDVITGTIKANFPTRISFQVSSRIDSTTILGDKGAEQLLGKGDMLYMMGVGRLLRVHGPFVSDKEVDRVVELLKQIDTPQYIKDVTEDKEISENTNSDNNIDELYNDVIELIKQEKKVSTSYIQRRFQIGYNRAARIVESLEENGVISKASATGKRDILIN